jgi:hypothetical protein
LTAPTTLPSTQISWDVRTDGGRLFFIQKELLITQTYMFDHVNGVSNDSEKTFNYWLSQLQVRLKSFERTGGASKDAIAVLNERIRVLTIRKEMLPAWREMNVQWRQGSDFWGVALGKMSSRILDSQQIIIDLAKTNVLSSPDLHLYRPDLGTYSVTRKLFAELDNEPGKVETKLPEITIGRAM